MRILLLILLLLKLSIADAQHNLQFYKLRVDDLVTKTIPTNPADSIVLVDLLLTYSNASKNKFVQYDLVKDKKIIFNTATFFYRLYKAGINFSFRVSGTINFNNETSLDSAYLKPLPKCVLTNSNCGFISADSAISISKQDTIPNQDNLSIFLISENKTDHYFWYVIAKPAATKDKRKKGLPTSRRVIDAITGHIISRTQIWDLDK